MFEKTQSFKNLGVTTISNNDWNAEIASRIGTQSGKSFIFALVKYFKSKLFSRGTKIPMYMSIIRQTLTCMFVKFVQ